MVDRSKHVQEGPGNSESSKREELYGLGCSRQRLGKRTPKPLDGHCAHELNVCATIGSYPGVNLFRIVPDVERRRVGRYAGIDSRLR